MIDREARFRAANLVEQFWNGSITNDDLERSWPDSRDEGIRAVEDLVWTLYSDLKAHTIGEAETSNPRLMVIIPNCISFLRTSEEYKWPHSGTIQGAKRYPTWAVILSFGVLALWNRRAEAREQRYWVEMRAHGDVDAWPFSSKLEADPTVG
jgi:hypothetical protein